MILRTQTCYNKYMDRLILHCDLNNFYASVECLNHPEWRDRPLAVAGSTEKRHGVVLAKNEIAKSFGIKTGDVIWQARQKAPELTVVPPHFDEYMRFSKIAFDVYSNYTCYVEPFGADECWLDCTGSVKLFGSGEEIAHKIREDIYKTTGGLTVSVGVSFNKIFAKLGSDLKKPDAVTVITRDNFKEKLWNLPASDMMMVGRSTAEKLKKLNIHTIGELAEADVNILKAHFGINGVKLHANARGENSDGVREYVKSRKVESVGHGMTAMRDITTYEDAKALVYFLCEMVTSRMRKYGFRGGAVSVNLRGSDLKHITRQHKLPVPTYATRVIAESAFALLKDNWTRRVPLRTVTVSVFDLTPIDGAVQTSMFDDEMRTKEEALERAMDTIRAKYGHDSISRANVLGKDFIYDKTEAEDFLPFQR